MLKNAYDSFTITQFFQVLKYQIAYLNIQFFILAQKKFAITLLYYITLSSCKKAISSELTIL